MGKNKFLEILLQVFLLILGLVVIWIIRNEIIISFAIIILLLLSFKIRYYKKEGLLFLTGAVTGFTLEIVSDLIYKLQYWQEGSLFGIPIWLPILWGYGFIFIRRIGNLIIE